MRPRRFRGILTGAWQAGRLGFGVMLAWFFFHLLAQKLISLPANFHDGTLWQKSFFDSSGDNKEDDDE